MSDEQQLPPPGWYADPAGGRSQKYWDGQEWSDTGPAKQRKPMSRLAKVGIGIAVAFVVLVIIGSLVDKPPADEQTAEPTSSSTPEPTTAAPAEPTEEPSSEPAPAAPTTPQAPTPPSGVTARVGSGPNGDVVVTEFDIHDAFTKGMIARQAQRDTVKILKWADEAYPQAVEVTVQGRFPMKDAYGNTSNMTILDVTYSRATLDKVNFDGIDSDRIWEIRDYGTVHAELQQ